MTVNNITINAKTYRLARQSLLPAGARRWEVSKRPSQISDGQLREAEWKVWGANFASYEDDSGYLGVDYGSDVDTRWEGACYLAPARTSVTLTTNPAGTPANTNCTAFITGPSSVRYMYVGRGTRPAKVRVSDFTVMGEGAAALAERITSAVQTRNAAGTEEISFGMAATAYQVITTVAAPTSNDTYSANDESIINRIMYVGADRVFGMTGQVLRGNVLSGTVTMDASAWNTNATFAGETITPTSMAMDGNLLVVGTSNGPYMFDSERGTFFPLMDGLDQHSSNCKEMKTWPGKGVLIPTQTGLILERYGDCVSIGIERYKANTSTVQGIPVAIAVTATDAFAMVVYNPVTANYWLVEGRPRETGDWHDKPFSYYVMGDLSTTAVEHMTWAGTQDGARTQPALVVGQSSNMLYINYGRTNRHPDDSGYTYRTSGTLYLTELRREPHLRKDIIGCSFYAGAATGNLTIQPAVSLDGAAYVNIGSSSVQTTGYQRVLFVDSNEIPVTGSGFHIKPKIVFASNTASSSPRIDGKFKLHYKVRPTMINVYDFTIELGEENNYTVEEQADTLLALWGTAPVLVSEDADMDAGVNKYVRVESVKVTEVQEKGGPDGGKGPIRIAQVRMEGWPVSSGQ